MLCSVDENKDERESVCVSESVRGMRMEYTLTVGGLMRFWVM